MNKKNNLKYLKNLYNFFIYFFHDVVTVRNLFHGNTGFVKRPELLRDRWIETFRVASILKKQQFEGCFPHPHLNF